MQRFGRIELDQMISGLHPEDYEGFDTTPLVALLYEDVLHTLRDMPGVDEFKVLQYIACRRDYGGRLEVSAIPPAMAQFSYEGYHTLVEFGSYDAGAAGRENGIIVSGVEPEAEGIVLGLIRNAAARYDAGSIWLEAVGRRLCSETAQEYAARDTEWQTGLNLRIVNVYKNEEAQRHRAVWTFDGKEFLWGPREAGSPIPSTASCSMLLTIGNNPAGQDLYGAPLIAALADRPIMSWDYEHAGLCPSYTVGMDRNTTRVFFADPQREAGLLAAFDSLAATISMRVLMDGRKR